jgi:hypothetical protein
MYVDGTTRNAVVVVDVVAAFLLSICWSKVGYILRFFFTFMTQNVKNVHGRFLPFYDDGGERISHENRVFPNWPEQRREKSNWPDEGYRTFWPPTTSRSPKKIP